MSMPRSEPELTIWLNNFAARFSAHATALGFTAAEASAVQADADMLQYLVGDLIPTFRNALQSRTTYKNMIKDGAANPVGGPVPAMPTVPAPPATVAPGIVPRLRQLIQRIQFAPAYTEAIGQDLGITDDAPPDPVDPATAKPDVKAVALANSEVRIEFVKEGFDGVAVETRHIGENSWTLLGVDNYSPYLDSRPPVTQGQAEVREYRLRYILKDKQVGEWSDIVSASTTP